MHNEYMKNLIEKTFEAHENNRFCVDVLQMDIKNKCKYIGSIPDCKRKWHLTNYVGYTYCHFEMDPRICQALSVIWMTVVMFYMFMIIAITANIYLLPALKLAARKLHLGEHLAGITLLSYVTSLPEFFIHFANEEQKTSLLYSQSLCCAVIVSTITGGLVCYISPFRMSPMGTMQSLLFFILGVQLLEYSKVNDECITIMESFLLCGFYIIYIAVSLIDDLLVKHQITQMQEELLHYYYDVLSDESDLPQYHQLEKNLKSMYEQNQIKIIRHSSNWFSYYPYKLQSRSMRYQWTFTTSVVKSKREIVDIEATKFAKYDDTKSANFQLFSDFWLSIKPFRFLEWEEAGFARRCLIAILVPLRFLCQLYLPLVDGDTNRHGWTKLLNCLQIILSPTLLIIMPIAEQYILYTFLITIPLAVAVFFTSRTDVPPCYHMLLFSIINIGGSILITHYCITMLTKTLAIFGYMLGTSEDFLTSILMALGQSVANLVTNVSMALHGYEEMAFAAGYGGPFFNLIFSLGVVFGTQAWFNESGMLPIEHENLGELAFVMLLLGSVTSLIWTMFLNFTGRRSIGIFCLFLFGIFTIYSVLVERGVIHSFNKDLSITVV